MIGFPRLSKGIPKAAATSSCTVVSSSTAKLLICRAPAGSKEPPMCLPPLDLDGVVGGAGVCVSNQSANRFCC